MSIPDGVPGGHPPCFSGDRAWLEYIEAAAATDRVGNANNVAQAGRLRPAWSYCLDCPSAHKAAMLEASRCMPMWLRKTLAGG